MAGSYNTTGCRNGDGILVVQGQTAVTQATSITTGVTCSAYSGVTVKLLVGLSGPAGTLEPGDDYECDQWEASRLIERGFATPIVAPRIERAVAAPVVEKRKARAKKDAD